VSAGNTKYTHVEILRQMIMRFSEMMMIEAL